MEHVRQVAHVADDGVRSERPFRSISFPGRRELLSVPAHQHGEHSQFVRGHTLAFGERCASYKQGGRSKGRLTDFPQFKTTEDDATLGQLFLTA